LNYIRLWKLEFCRIWKAVSNGWRECQFLR
jgi:hypothetical protein